MDNWEALREKRVVSSFTEWKGVEGPEDVNIVNKVDRVVDVDGVDWAGVDRTVDVDRVDRAGVDRAVDVDGLDWARVSSNSFSMRYS